MHNSKKSSTFAADFALMSEQSHYIIELSRMPAGTHEFDIQLDNEFFSSVEKSEILSGKVDAKVVLNLREEHYSLTIAIRGVVQVVCDRCLDPMDITIEDEQEIDGDEEMSACESLSGSNDVLDLSWLVYEIASINIPLVHCHPTGGCNAQMDLLLQSHLCDEPDAPEE